MSILKSVRSWWGRRGERERAAYARNEDNATPQESAEIKERRGLMRFRLKALSTGGLREGTGISPTGTPIDFTADQKPPKY